MILTLAEYKSLTGTTSAANDTLITALLPAVQSQIQVLCDRLFDLQDYYEWHNYSPTVIVSQYPLTQLKFLGTIVRGASFSPTTGYNYEITFSQTTGLPVNLVITNDLTFASTTFALAPLVDLAGLKVAVEAALPAITLTIESGYATTNYRLFKRGSGTDLYVAERLNAITRIDDNRTAVMMEDLSFLFFLTMDVGTDVQLFVMYTAGYATADVPQALKLIAANIIKDIVSIQTGSSGGAISGLYKSETIGNYSYTMAIPVSATATLDIANIVLKYADQLYPFRKKTI